MTRAHCLDILNLPHHATAEEIKKQFRALSLKFHPDKNSSTEALEKYIEIKFAYEALASNIFSSVDEIDRLRKIYAARSAADEAYKNKLKEILKKGNSSENKKMWYKEILEKFIKGK